MRPIGSNYFISIYTHGNNIITAFSPKAIEKVEFFVSTPVAHIHARKYYMHKRGV